MQAFDFDKVLDQILSRDSRYTRSAYHFVREALDYTQKAVLKTTKGKPRHVTGQELLEGIRLFAIEQFGPMAQLVLEEWGVRDCAAFGDIVFNLVDHNVLARTETDRREDFQPGYDFHTAFRKPFLPREAPVAHVPRINSPGN
jgi:uncharacterized repeat protein (TIGR04138 family)